MVLFICSFAGHPQGARLGQGSGDTAAGLTQSLLSGTPHILRRVSPLHLQPRLLMKSPHPLLLQVWLSRRLPWDPAGLLMVLKWTGLRNWGTRLEEASSKAPGLWFLALCGQFRLVPCIFLSSSPWNSTELSCFCCSYEHWQRLTTECRGLRSAGSQKSLEVLRSTWCC